MNNNFALTVITPTYNRAYVLNKGYESLCRQNCKEFVWMIVDDGSTDHTESLVAGWIKEAIINIVYFKKQNGGKASALNVAFEQINTPYCVCLDSDDYFTDTAIEEALALLEEEKNNDKCCGVLSLHKMPDGSYFGGKGFSDGVKYMSVPEIHLSTEYSRFYKTATLLNVRFPEFPGEKFVSPIYIDYLLAQSYKFRIAHNSFCVCEYMNDGLTKNKRKVILRNPHGYTAVKRFSFMYASTLEKVIKNGIMYDCGCIIGKDKNWLKNSPRKIWSIMLYPLGYVVYLQRFRRLQEGNDK